MKVKSNFRLIYLHNFFTTNYFLCPSNNIMLLRIWHENEGLL